MNTFEVVLPSGRGGERVAGMDFVWPDGDGWDFVFRIYESGALVFGFERDGEYLDGRTWVPVRAYAPGFWSEASERLNG